MAEAITPVTTCEWDNNATSCLENLMPMDNGTMPAPPQAAENMIDEELRYIFMVVFFLSLQIPTLTVGIFTNLVNIAVFCMMGLKNSMSIAFLALSISDLGYVIFFFVIRMLMLLQHVVGVQSRIRPSFFSFFFRFYGLYFQDVSVVITIFIAVQKCLCVAIPHLFKDFFTPRRTVVILACLYLSMTMGYVPILGAMKWKEVRYPPGSNTTQVILSVGEMYHDGMRLWRVFNKIVLPASAQGVSIVCLVVMFVQLTRSAKFRASQGDCADLDDNNDAPGSQKAPKVSVKLGYRERRAVNAMVWVLVLFVACTMPTTVLNFSQLIVPEFFVESHYNLIVYPLNISQNIFTHINASVNIIIYLKYNTKFKASAKILFNWCLCGGHKKSAKEAENV